MFKIILLKVHFKMKSQLIKMILFLIVENVIMQFNIYSKRFSMILFIFKIIAELNSLIVMAQVNLILIFKYFFN